MEPVVKSAKTEIEINSRNQLGDGQARPMIGTRRWQFAKKLERSNEGITLRSKPQPTTAPAVHHGESLSIEDFPIHINSGELK